MELKIKAQRLVRKYIDILNTSDLNVCHTDTLENETRITAIECALYSVQFAKKCYSPLNILDLDDLEKEIKRMRDECN